MDGGMAVVMKPMTISKSHVAYFSRQGQLKVYLCNEISTIILLPVVFMLEIRHPNSFVLHISLFAFD